MIIMVSWKEWLEEVTVAKAADAAAAHAAIDAMSENRTAYVFDTEAPDWLDVQWRHHGTVKLAHIFNALTPDALVKKFENRDVALRRVGIRLIELARSAPLIERAPDAIKDARNQGGVDMAREARIGEFKPVRKDTHIGKIVIAHAGGTTNLQEMATLVGMTPDQVKTHLRAARGNHGIGHSVNNDTGEVSLLIPEGVEVFRRVKEKEVRAPREPKYGAFAQVRATTVLGRIVAAAPATPEALGAAAGIDPDAAMTALKRARITHGIEHSVDGDGIVSVSAHGMPDGTAILKEPAAQRTVRKTDGVPRQGKNARLDADAATGAMPEKPIVTSETNKHRQKHFDELAAYAEAGEWDKVAAKHMKGIDSYSGMINRYRDRLLAAHAARSTQVAAE